MPCSWGGNGKSGVALAMRHRLQWFIHVQSDSLRKRDEHPAYAPHEVWHSFVFFKAYWVIQSLDTVACLSFGKEQFIKLMY